MTAVLFVALIMATFYVWSCIMFWSPVEPPAATKPLLALGLAWVLSTVPPRPLEVIAAAGAAGLVYYIAER